VIPHVERWMGQINEHAPKDVVRVLAGNKLDLGTERVVQFREGQALANKHDIPFMEVSAKTGENVPDLFLRIAEQLVDEYLPNRVAERQRYSLCSNASLALKNEKRQCEC
jgi:GTPase SAR1 family protein